jgi:origin recognition complex subunit 4
MVETPRSARKRRIGDDERTPPGKKARTGYGNITSSSRRPQRSEAEEAALYDDIEGAHKPLATKTKRTPAKRPPAKHQREPTSSTGKERSVKRYEKSSGRKKGRLSEIFVAEEEEVVPHSSRASRTSRRSKAKADVEVQSRSVDELAADPQIADADDETGGVSLNGYLEDENGAVEQQLLEESAAYNTPSRRKEKRSQKKALVTEDEGEEAEASTAAAPSLRKKRVPKLLAELADTPEYAKAKAPRRTEYDEILDGSMAHDTHPVSQPKSSQRRSALRRGHTDEVIGADDIDDSSRTPSRRDKRQKVGTRLHEEVLGIEDELQERTPRRRLTREFQNGNEVMEDRDGMAIDVEAPVRPLNLSTESPKASTARTKAPSTQIPPNLQPQLDMAKKIVLAKLSKKRPTPLVGLDDEYSKVYSLLHATVTAGESNSMLLIGARGSGKSTLVRSALDELSKESPDDFHAVKLNGFIHTDDKIALRDIWRQLGREMDVDEDETSGPGKSYADTLAMLLALLSHADESSRDDETQRVSKSVIFVMDEFDLFASHPRQTLLYNLLDIAQSRKAPIAVLGLTTRIDVTDALEKRVKSRFSHRYVHIGLPRSLSAFNEGVKAALQLNPDELSFEEKTALLAGKTTCAKKGKDDTLEVSVLSIWNGAVDVCLR